MPVTIQMHESGDLSLTPSCLEEDNDRRKCVEKSAAADDALSQGLPPRRTPINFDIQCHDKVKVTSTINLTFIYILSALIRSRSANENALRSESIKVQFS